MTHQFLFWRPSRYTVAGTIDYPEGAFNTQRSEYSRGGRAFMRAGCATCHGPGARGGVIDFNADDPESTFPELVEVNTWQDKDGIVEVLQEGVIEDYGPPPKYVMPSYQGKLTLEEMELIADYLMGLTPPEESP